VKSILVKVTFTNIFGKKFWYKLVKIFHHVSLIIINMLARTNGALKKCCAEDMCVGKDLNNGMCDNTHRCVSGKPAHSMCSEPHPEMRDPLNPQSEVEGFGSINYCTRCYLYKIKEDAWMESDSFLENPKKRGSKASAAKEKKVQKTSRTSSAEFDDFIVLPLEGENSLLLPQEAGGVTAPTGGVRRTDENEDNNDDGENDDLGDDDDEETQQDLPDDVQVQFDAQGSVIIPKTKYTCDETEEMNKNCGTKKGTDALCENLFSYLSIVAYDAVSQERTLKYSDLCLRVAQSMEDSYKNYPLKQEAANGILRIWCGKWPAVFQEFYDIKKRAKLTGTFLAGQGSILANSSPHIQQLAYWGSVVLKKAKETSSFINTKLNHHWSGDFNSGETPSGLLRAIRKSLWPEAALERAKYALYQCLKSNKGLKMTEQQKADSLEKRQAKALSKMNYTFYPKYWLAFVYRGRPAQVLFEPHTVSQHLNSGKMVKKPSSEISPCKDLSMFGKDVRRHANELPHVQKGPYKKQDEMSVTIKRFNGTAREQQIANLKERIVLYEKLGDHDQANSLSRELIRLLEIAYVDIESAVHTAPDASYSTPAAVSSSSSSSARAPNSTTSTY
jgi:hypothetical protein